MYDQDDLFRALQRPLFVCPRCKWKGMVFSWEKHICRLEPKEEYL